MNYLTRFYFQFNNIIKYLNTKIIKLKRNLLFLLFSLFFGFLIGNLFGTLVENIKFIYLGNTLLIIIIILITEFINFFSYNNKNSLHIFKLYTFLNTFKIGILLGFFIDSYKVGS